ncbi:EamA family transporter [Bosea sp. 117]|uniref:aromatic amino acid exporter YddG n=1 Tax=Bosea sp. 117 TaxID=1125973 RepID=UPI000493EDD5|nr:EamA family transporter [Bosea sp. 117]
MSRITATLVGCTAILLWSTLALATSATGAVPPFLLTALTFSIGGAVGLAAAVLRGVPLGVLRQPWPVWLHGVGGLFGYHFFYFSALKLAPPAEAGLIAYLWPLLIVLMSSLLPGEKLKSVHVIGALMGLAGTVVLLGGRAGGLGFSPAYLPGYGAALLCAFIWSGYSVLSRRFQSVPTDVVAGFCLATAALSALCHLAFEPHIWPSGTGEWLAVAALGAGPVGLAFYTWDIGMKRGDIKLLGIASYAAPVLSTLLLVAAGYAAASWSLAVACGLIVGGALVATVLARKQPAESRRSLSQSSST